MSTSAWSPWQPVPPLPHAVAFTPALLAELLDGGQAFRWHRHPDGTYEGGWANHHVRLRLAPSPGLAELPSPSAPAPTLEFSSPGDPTLTAAALHAYLAGPPADEDALPWRSDAHLATCLAACPGLRILRQPFGETLLGFLCSATKQIVQIKQMMALLATHHGQPLSPQPTSQSIIDNVPSALWHRLPTWPELATVSENQLRACALGFRARHVAAIARLLAADPTWLTTTEHAPYPEAKTRLLTLPGIGEKVADCVLLFGAGRLDAFPVDTWIIKAMVRRYRLDDWKPAQIAHFGRTHFGPHAGLAQQYLFAYERAQAKE